MGRPRMRAAAFLLSSAFLLAGCEKKNVVVQGADTTSEPDKQLYERSLADIQQGRETVARFSLETLLNTYPDSEYVAKAKLAIADSYYKDGTTEGLAQAINEYKDFITFFPYLDEAAYAQYRVGMAHFRQMEKPDRDQTQVQLAEQEFQNYLLKYPQGAQAAEVEQKLREVQEVIAEGDFRVAKYYYDKSAYYASAHRLTEVVDRYPLYSQADEALWMLAQSAEHFEQLKPYANDYLKRIVRDYPLSAHAQSAKAMLEKAGVPVPQPNPEALARMQSEKERAKQKTPITQRAMGLLKSGPSVATAAHSGSPQMNPPGEENTESLSGGGGSTDIVVGGSGQTAHAGPPPVAVVRPRESPAGNAAVADPNAPAGAAATDAAAPDAAKPALPDLLPNHEPKPVKKGDKKPEESSSKKKKGFWKIFPF
jgi:outer membrane protein assembly factor BamD